MSAAPEYASESWFRKLFTGPEEHRLKIGDNDPDWNKDIAAAVRRTVAFVDAELELELGERDAAVGASTPPSRSAASASSSSLGGHGERAREPTRPVHVAGDPAAAVDGSERKKPKRDLERAEVIDLEASPLKATAPLAPVPASSAAAGSHSVNVATPAAAAAMSAPNAAAHTAQAAIALDAGGATPSASSAEAALAAPGPGPPAAPMYTAPNPSLVLKWTDRETLEWLAERFALTADGPA